MNVTEYRRRIERVMEKRCPRAIETRGSGKEPIRHPWRFLGSQAGKYSVDLAFEVPTGYSAADLRQELDALFAACGAYIEIEDRAGAVVVSIYPEEFPMTIEFEPSMLDLAPVGRNVLLGFDRQMNPIYHNFRVPHLLIAGMSGYGKTDLIRWILFQLIHRFTPEELAIEIIDMKGFSFLPFRRIPHIRRIVRDLPGALDVLKQGHKLMIDRSNKVWDADDRETVAGFRWHIVLIDEAAQIAPAQIRDPELKQLALAADSYAASISAVGREAGVGLLYATQRPSADVINPLVKANMEAALCFRTKTQSNSEIVIDRPGAERLPIGKPGRAIYAATEDKILQVPYIGDDSKWRELLDPYRKELIPSDHENGENGDYTGDLD